MTIFRLYAGILNGVRITREQAQQLCECGRWSMCRAESPDGTEAFGAVQVAFGGRLAVVTVTELKE